MVDLGEGGHGGAPACVAHPLLDRHRRRQARDRVHVRTFQDLDVLSHIGREAFEIPALAFGEEDVEGHGGFARSGYPGKHHEFVPWDGDVYVPEVVFPGPAHVDDAAVCRGRGRCGGRHVAKPGVSFQVGREKLSGVGPGGARHLLGGSLGHHPAAAVSPPGPQVYHPVGGLDHVHVVFDHEHRVSPVHEPVERGEELVDVLEVEPGGGFVEYEQAVCVVRGREVPGKLEPLGLAARQGVDGLAQGHVPEPHPGERREKGGEPGRVLEEGAGLVHGHGKNAVDVFAPVGDVQHLGQKPRAPALRAGDEHVREELHLDLFEPFAPARGASARGRVEGEEGGGDAPCPCLAGACEEGPHPVHGLGVGEGVGPGGPADGTLVHEHGVGHGLRALDRPVGPGPALGRPLEPFHRPEDDVFGQGGFSGAGHPGETHEKSQRYVDVDPLEVVLGRAPHGEPAVLPGLPAALGHGDAALAPHILPGEAAGDLGSGARVHDPAAPGARPGPQVDHVVRLPYEFRVVFHHHHGVSQVPQALEDAHETEVVPGVKTDARLVEHVEGVDQGRADGRGERRALHLAARKGPRLAVEGEVAEAHLFQVPEPPAHLAEHHTGRLVSFRDAKAFEEGERPVHVERVHLRDGEPPEPVAEGPVLEPGPPAAGAHLVGPVAGQEHPHVHLVGLGLEPPEEPAHAVVVVGAVYDGTPVGRVQPVERHRGGDAGAPAEVDQVGELHALPGAVAPGLDGAFPDGEPRVGDHEILVQVDDSPEPPAGVAGPDGAVEGKEGGVGFTKGGPAPGAGKPAAEGTVPGGCVPCA